jgi:hypothetical protein
MRHTLSRWNERFVDNRHAGFSPAGLGFGLAMYFAPLAGIIGLLTAGLLGEYPLVLEAESAVTAMGPTPVPTERND